MRAFLVGGNSCGSDCRRIGKESRDAMSSDLFLMKSEAR
jgi:hypothetical protein